MDFFADGLAFRLRETAQCLLYRLGVRVNIECVLSEFPGNTWHVGWFPCKYFPALTEELDEHAFLCVREVIRHIGAFLRVRRLDLRLRRLLRGLELFIGRFSCVDKWLLVVD